MKNQILFFLLLSTTLIYSQNLITNPGFEICDKCGQSGNPGVEFFGTSNSNKPVDWFGANPGSSDIRESFPYVGKRHGGFFSFGKYEYLGNVLASKLEPGATYKFSFYLAARESDGYSLDEIGVAFHTGLPYYNDLSLERVVTPAWTTPDGEHLPVKTYKQYSFEYMACGNEDHIIIGRFKGLGKNDTTFIGTGKPPSQVYPYTFVDEVELVKIKDAPKIVTEKEILLCEEDFKRIGIAPGFLDVSWSNGDRGDSTNVKLRDTLVIVEAKFDKKCPSIRDTVYIKMKPFEIENKVLFTEDTICFPKDSLLKANSLDYTLFFWSDGQRGNPIKINGPGNYGVRASRNCKYSDAYIEVIGNLNFDSLFRFPNVFTPLDNVNNTFGPYIAITLKDKIQEYEFEVFNRWGKRVFHTKDKDSVWRPDSAFPTETYTYQLNCKVSNCNKTEVIQKKGMVTLIR